MPANPSPDVRRGQLPQTLFWAGMALAPLAVLVLLFGQSTGSLRVAVVLAVLTIVLLAISIALRPTVEMVRVDIEHRVLDEMERIRLRSREETAAITHNAQRAIAERIAGLHESVEHLRAQVNQVQQVQAYVDSALFAPPALGHHAPAAIDGPAPPPGVIRRTETVQVTRHTTYDDTGLIYGNRADYDRRGAVDGEWREATDGRAEPHREGRWTPREEDRWAALRPAERDDRPWATGRAEPPALPTSGEPAYRYDDRGADPYRDGRYGGRPGNDDRADWERGYASDQGYTADRGYSGDRGYGSDRGRGHDRGEAFDRGRDVGRGGDAGDRGPGGAEFDRGWSRERGSERGFEPDREYAGRGYERGSLYDRGPDRGYDHDRGPGPDRGYGHDRGYGRGTDHGFPPGSPVDRGRDGEWGRSGGWGPEGDRNHGRESGYDRGYDREPDRGGFGYDRPGDRPGYEREPGGRGTGRDWDAGPERDRGYERYDRGSSWDREREPTWDRGSDRGPSWDREPERGWERGPERDSAWDRGSGPDPGWGRAADREAGWDRRSDREPGWSRGPERDAGWDRGYEREPSRERETPPVPRPRYPQW